MPGQLDSPPSNLSSPAWVVISILDSEERTSRLCRIIGQITVGVVSTVLPLVAVLVVVTVKAPADLKYILGGGSTILIWLGSWLLARRRSTKYRPKQRSPGTKKVIDNGGDEGNDPG
jgi:hypothetical protein